MLLPSQCPQVVTNHIRAMGTIAEPMSDSAEPAEEWSAQQPFRGDEKSALVHLFRCVMAF